MADLAVGLSKTVVAGALSRVQTVIAEDAKLREKAQRDLVLISLEFEMMQSFLNVASDEIGTTKNNLVRTWVRHVRDLANDLEDSIEFAVGLCRKPIFWRRLLPSCIAPPLPLDQVVAEIEDLNGRAKELSNCYMRYSRIADSSGSKIVMLQQPSGRATDATASNVISKARGVARNRQGLGDLTQLITKKLGNELQVISMWETGDDLGTTSIIMKAYNDPEIIQNFACRSWVKLMHPFNPREFVRRFMAQVYADACKQQGARVGVHVLTKMEANQDDILEEFVEEVNTKTYLVVLDNLIDKVDWDAVKTFLPDMKNGSSIIVSTQQLEIARLCIGHSYQAVELKQFSTDHSVCAFFKQGSQDCGDKDEKLALSQVGQNSSYGKTHSSNRKAATYWMENYPLVGRETEMNELRRYTAMARINNSPVISVWGIAGIGKSALVRNLYFDRMLRSDQFNKHIWVDVSHPFNLRDFSQSLISDYHSDKDPIEECRELLSHHRCLVVIDDLQSKEEWDLIQAAWLPRSSASIIIVITTEASIAAYCTNHEDQVLDVKGLDPVAAMSLFRLEVKRKNRSCPFHTHEDAELEEVILKCGGLPKVIVCIASLLATQTVTPMDTVRSLNHRFMHHLENNPEYDILQGLFDWMNSYFNTFPDSLKPCIFYLSVFPPDHRIRRERLVRRWIAEGYSRESEEESAIDKGEKLFSKLLDLSIIQKIPELATIAFNDTKMVLFQVNGFIREYISSRKMEENLVFELGPNCFLNTQCTGRHLIILRDWDRQKIVFESIDFSRLRSLTVFGKWESFFISKSMRLLRVLDLEDALGLTDEDLKTMVERLHRLKFLSLRGCSEICNLPSSLGNLRQLQNLDVRYTRIVTLPASISKLHKLQSIHGGAKVLSSTPPASFSRLTEFRRDRGLVGVKVPRGIGKLTALHRLGVVNVGASGRRAIVEELKKLTQLRKLGVSGINRHNINEFISETSGLVHLESLVLKLDNDNQGCLDEISLPWENLQSLALYGLGNILPLRNPIRKLSKLVLEMDTLQKNDMELLARLPGLCILELLVKQLEDGELHFCAKVNGLELDTFGNVKILEVTCRSNRLHLIFESKSMKKLEQLKIDCSSALYQLTGLNDLSGLKEIVLKGTNDTTIKTNFERELISHPNKPRPTVRLA